MSLRRKIYEVIEVADKDDRDSLIYDRFMLVCIAASIVPLCFKETNALFIWLDRATVTVFIVDYLLRWWTADLKYEKERKMGVSTLSVQLFRYCRPAVHPAVADDAVVGVQTV